MFSRKASYAIRAAVFLAKEYGRGPVKVERIATSENIPRKFLEAIMLDLKRAGLAHSTRGKQGGYVLARAPAQITVAQLLQAVGSQLAALSSFGTEMARQAASGDAPSAVHLVSEELRTSIHKVIEQKTLEALVHQASSAAVQELDFVI